MLARTASGRRIQMNSSVAQPPRCPPALMASRRASVSCLEPRSSAAASRTCCGAEDSLKRRAGGKRGEGAAAAAAPGAGGAASASAAWRAPLAAGRAAPSAFFAAAGVARPRAALVDEMHVLDPRARVLHARVPAFRVLYAALGHDVLSFTARAPWAGVADAVYEVIRLHKHRVAWLFAQRGGS